MRFITVISGTLVKLIESLKTRQMSTFTKNSKSSLVMLQVKDLALQQSDLIAGQGISMSRKIWPKRKEKKKVEGGSINGE